MAKSTGRPPKFTVAQIITALEASAGIISAAARLLRCDVKTVYRYIERHAEIRSAMEDVVDERLDVAEAGLLKFLSDSKNPVLQLKACEFYLLTKGKKRGYTKQTEVVGKDGGAVQTKTTFAIDLSNCTPEDIATLEQAALMAVGAVAVRH